MDKPVTHIQILHIVPVPLFQMFTVAAAVLPTNAGDLLYQVKNLTGECIKGAWGRFNPLNVNDADRRHRIRKRVSANDVFRRHRLARTIRVVFLYLRAFERNVTLGAPVAVVGPSHNYLIVSSGRTRGAQSTAALCAKFHADLLD